MHAHRTAQRSPEAGEAAEEVCGECGQGPSLWLCGKEWVRQGKQALGLASLNSFSGLWGIGAVLNCLGPGWDLALG